MSLKPFSARVSHARHFLSTGFVLLALVVVVSAWVSARERHHEAATDRILLLKDDLSNVLSATRQAESAQRGYLLTGDTAYLEPYGYAAETSVPRNLAALRQMIAGGPEAGEVAQIQSLVGIKLAELSRTIALYKSGQRTAALAIVRTNVGLNTMTQLRDLIRGMQIAETARYDHSEKLDQRNAWLLELTTAALVICTFLLAWFAIRENRLQNLQIAANEAELRGANEELERKVEERTATLRASQAALAEANASLEIRVAERSRELDRIFRLSNDILVVADFEAKFRNLSPAWGQITGWPENESLGRSFERFVHPDDQPGIRPALRRLRAGEPMVSFECRIRRADGGWSWLAWRAVPLREEQMIYAIGRDVTQDKAREEQLRQSQKMEIVGQLTGGIAHDFNNLLTIIMGSLELLARDIAGQEKPARRVEAAMGGARRAAALTHRLLAFSRRQPLAPQPLEVNRLLAGMSDMLHRTLGETIAIEQVNAPALWPALADANQLENVILNLVVNARDAMPKGGLITISTANVHLDQRYAAAHADTQAGDYVCIAIADCGTGMSDAVKAKVFEPFFTTKPQGQGTGLGLAQVYGFISQSGGHVAIDSEVGRGTTIKLYLPRVLNGGAAPAESEPSEAAPGSAAGETILLVEDEEGVRAFSAEILENLGYRVLAAENAAEALRIFEANPEIDMLFTDVVLTGGTNGRQLADNIAARRPGIIVLFTTGYTRNAIVHDGRLDEGLNFIGKPFSASELGRKIGQLFERVASRTQPAES